MTKKRYLQFKELEERLTDLEIMIHSGEYDLPDDFLNDLDDRNHLFRIGHLIGLLVFEEEK